MYSPSFDAVYWYLAVVEGLLLLDTDDLNNKDK